MSNEKKKRPSVLFYLAILFVVALILLLISYLMEQRSTIDGLMEESASTLQSAQEVYAENKELKAQLAQLQEQLDALEDTMQSNESQYKNQTNILETQVGALQKQLTALEEKMELTNQAMDWFWQINEAFSRGRYYLARQLIEQMGEELPQYLPTESITDNGRFSPYDRYQEIYDALY